VRNFADKKTVYQLKMPIALAVMPPRHKGFFAQEQAQAKRDSMF
jgi:hypothetical protein